MRNRIHSQLYTGFALLMMVLIYLQIYRFSDMPAEISGEQSTSMAELIVERVEGLLSIDLPFNNSQEALAQWNGFVRKAAHFSEFALLGLFAYSIAFCWNRQQKKGSIFCFLFITLLAAADELHQYFVPGRWCSFRDVCIDSAGGMAGMLFLRFWYGIYSRWKRKVRRRS